MTVTAATPSSITHGLRPRSHTTLCGLATEQIAVQSDYDCHVCRIASELTIRHGVIDAIELVRAMVLHGEVVEPSAMKLAAHLGGSASAAAGLLLEGQMREQAGERVLFIADSRSSGVLVVGEHVASALREAA